jgi:RNA polymerase sigma factor (sigma-70 family)
MHYTDPEILKALKSGDTGGPLEFLYEMLFPKVRRYIRNNSGDPSTAFDVFQDSMMVFYRYVMENKFDQRYDIAGFIFTVSKNIWLNRIRKESREVNLPDNTDFRDEFDNILECMITKEREDIISELIVNLGKKCEELLRYSVFYHMKNSEICSKMGFSTENAVKTRKYKCMQKLILYIDERPSLKNILRET